MLSPNVEAEAHNLVVADPLTSFEGASAWLVHDNSMRAPTAAVWPGFLVDLPSAKAP